MSFASDAKKELTTLDSGKKCCQLAQISGFLRFAGSITLRGGLGIKVATDNPAVARYFATLVKDYFGTKISLNIEDGSFTKARNYQIVITPDLNADAILRETGILSVKEGNNIITDGLTQELLKKKCCRKSMLKAIFMAAGSVSSPGSKGYHMEISCNSSFMANDVKKLLASFDLKASSLQRRNKFIVYIKDGQQISDFMALIGASSAMLNYENMRITKEMKNHANRLTNCESANLDKMVAAAQKQIADIKKIGRNDSIDNLPPKLRDTAYLRLANPDMSMTELAALFNPPIKKSGLNHRFEKIAEIASKY